MSPQVKPRSPGVIAERIAGALTLLTVTVPSVDCQQLTGIHAAARDGDVARVEGLLDQNPGLVSAAEAAGWTPLHFAAQAGHEEVVALLLTRGADIDAKLKSGGGSPLHVAATAGRPAIVSLLLEAGAGANTNDDNEWTPLHRAAIGGHRLVAERLLEGGANAHAWSNTSVTPIDEARRSGHVGLSTFLESRGRSTLPLAERFADDCPWSSGENANFAFGCDSGAYRLHLALAGPVHVAQNFGWDVPSVISEVDATVESGRGTETGKALVGLGCLASRRTGYVGIVNTNGSWAIMRLDGEFLQLAGSNDVNAVPGLATTNRLRIDCAREDSGGITITFFANDRTVAAVSDASGPDRFNGVFLYTDTFPGLVAFERFTARVPPGPDEEITK